MSNGKGKLFSQTAPSGGLQYITTEKKNHVVGDTLNHNNMVKSLQKKHERDVVKLVKTVKAPPVRDYHGIVEVQEKRKLTGAIYAEEVEKEENELKKKQAASKELNSEELMHDKDYLKIDQSKLPLEIFDNLEFEERDRTPQQWLDSGSGGKAPYYHNGNWIFKPVLILGYNQPTNQYEVKYLPDGITKLVHRLNLQFDLEPEELFKERHRVAEEARSEAKAIMRLDYFITQQANEEIRAITKETIRDIHEKIIDGLPVYIPFPEQGTPLGLLLRNLTADIIQWYTRTVKRTVLMSKMLNPAFRDEITILRFNQLHLPPFPPKPLVPKQGKLYCPKYPYDERITRMKNLHYSFHIEVLNVLNWLYDKTYNKFELYRFMKTKLSEINLPCKLDFFRKLQNDQLDKTMKLLMKEFRRSFMDQLLDYVQDIFDFFQSNVKAYRVSTLYKLLRVLDLKLSSILREILIKSLNDWLELLDLYIITRPLISTEGYIKPAVTEFGWRRIADLRQRDTELIFPIFSQRQSLFQLKLVVNYNQNKIELEPSQEDIQSLFLTAIDKMITSLRSITSVDNEIMSLLTLETRILLNVGVGDPLFTDVDTYVRKIKTEITSKISIAMEQPNKLAKLLSQYMWLMTDDIDETLDIFMNTTPSPGRNEYFNELLRLDNTINSIINIGFINETYSLVEISIESAKSILLTRARDLRDGLSQLIANEARQHNISFIQRYNIILDRIAKKPINEKELADLREFIETSKKTVIELKQSVNENRQLLELLEYFNIQITIEDMGLSWSTLEYPSRVDSSGKEMEILLEADKIKMMDKLAFQKEYFEKIIENLNKEVKAAKLWDDYSDREKIFEKINSLMDNIEQAKEKAEDFNMREKVFGFVPTDYIILDKYTQELAPFYKLWTMISDFYNSKNDWLNGDFKVLDSKLIENNMNDWWKYSYKLIKQLEDEYPGASNCASQLREDTTEFKKHLPVIQSLASKALKPRHWALFNELFNSDIDIEEDLTLQQLLDLDAAKHIDAIQEITIRADKEYNLEKNLNIMKKEWEVIEFIIKSYRESGTFILSGIDEIVTMLDDHIVKTQTMRGSPYIKPIEDKCKVWEYKLKYAQSMLDELITCQRTWMYLEPIFSSEDIMRQLPTEARRFNGVDSLWKKTMSEIAIDANFMIQSDPEKRLEEKFKRANQKLEEITKGLNDYLETKRLCFPRRNIITK